MKTQFLMMILLAAITACSMACDDSSDNRGENGADGDGDADADTDGDTDGDADSDSDGDSDTWGFEITEQVTIKTSMGELTVGLFGNDGPVTVQNFLSYVDSGFFDGLIFHRVIPDFMIQGGGFDTDQMTRTAGDPIALEIIDGLKHQPGVISMARTEDKNSATSQFFICVADTPGLDGEYAAFGAVLSGYEIAEQISLVSTHTVGGHENVPVDHVVIESMSRRTDQ